MIAIVIPTKNNTTELFKCIESIHKFTHVDYQLFVADTGSESSIIHDTCKYLESFNGKHYRFIEYDYYNFAKINNDVVRNHVSAKFDTVLFCNNDIEIANDGLIDRMYQVYQKNTKVIGTIGCRLLYPNGKIQHDGQRFILPAKLGDSHPSSDRRNIIAFDHHRQFKKHETHPRPDAPVVAGNTFALALTPRNVFDKIGGLSEEYVSCFEDVQYNMECNLLGLANVIIESPYWAYHHESLTRGKGTECVDKLKIDYLKIRDFTLRNM